MRLLPRLLVPEAGLSVFPWVFPRFHHNPEVFRTEGARVLKTPVRAPKANAFAERFVRTVRAEVFDLVLVTGRRHLAILLEAYESHYNSHRPHRGIDLAAPSEIDVSPTLVPLERIQRTTVLGGLINEYHGAAA